MKKRRKVSPACPIMETLFKALGIKAKLVKVSGRGGKK